MTPKILVVDKMRGWRTRVARNLEKLGFQVIEAETGNEAIYAFKRDKDGIGIFFWGEIRTPFSRMKEIIQSARRDCPRAMMVAVSSSFERHLLAAGCTVSLPPRILGEEDLEAIRALLREHNLPLPD